jgi:hypothetical protein
MAGTKFSINLITNVLQIKLCGIYVRFPPVIVIPKLLFIIYYLPKLYSSQTQLTALSNKTYTYTHLRRAHALYSRPREHFILYTLLNFS